MRSNLCSQIKRTVSAAVIVLVSALPGHGEEQKLTVVVRPGQSEGEIDSALKIAAKSGMPVLLQVGDAAPVSAQQTGKSAAMPMTPELVATNIGMRSWEAFTAAVWRGAKAAWTGLSAVTALMNMTQAGLYAEGGDLGRAALVTGVCLSIGVIFGLLARVAITKFRDRFKRSSSRLLRVLSFRIVLDLASITVFFAAARLTLDHFLDQTSTAHQLSRGVVGAVLVGFLYVTAARWLFKSNSTGRALLNIENPSWHFRMLILHGVITAFTTETIRLAYAIGLNPNAIDGWFLICNTVLSIQKLLWFFVGRTDIQKAFIGSSDKLFRRLIGNVLPEFYMTATVVIWIAGFLVAGTPESARWSFAAGTSQIILLIAPIFALGATALLQQAVGNVVDSVEHRWWTAVYASSRVILSGGAWIASLHLIVVLWRPLMIGDAEIVTAWISWLERSSLAVVISWAVCTLIMKYFDCVAPIPEILMPGQDDDHVKRVTSRFSTAVPVARNLAVGAVLALAGLLILKSAGVDIAPLLAGFGVVGLAVSFGSQALVRDVVSGIFFIADDAFRIGEYIEIGSLKGTVEQITVRSVRLRHHNGPVHTIPFGQINSVTNLSRDWGTIKLELGFERDVDIDMIRKVAKNVGLQMLNDPEYGQDFILPLKMQGIQDLKESSMVIRFKFTCRPGNPGLIKREAMKRLIFAFRERGLPFASNRVTVHSASQEGTSVEALELAAAVSLRPTTALAV